NDARVLTAVHQNGLVHFAGNTRDMQNNRAAIYYGVLDPNGNGARLRVLSFDTLDLGYPDIAYAGTGDKNDHTATLSVTHVSENTMPGMSAVYMNYSGTFSPLTRIKEGKRSINELNDTMERWGDYSGVQRKYNEDRAFWMAGTYGDLINRTSIARVLNADPALGVKPEVPSSLKVYPNPSTEYVEIDF